MGLFYVLGKVVKILYLILKKAVNIFQWYITPPKENENCFFNSYHLGIPSVSFVEISILFAFFSLRQQTSNQPFTLLLNITLCKWAVVGLVVVVVVVIESSRLNWFLSAADWLYNELPIQGSQPKSLICFNQNANG